MVSRRGRSHAVALRATAVATLAAGAVLAGPATSHAVLPDLLAPVAQPVCSPLQTVASATQPVPVAGPVVQSGADLVCALGSAQLTWVTVYDPPGSAPPLRKEHAGVILVPTPLDIGGTVAPELIASLSVTPSGGAALTVNRAPGVTAPLAAAVEAVVKIPDGGTRTAAVGYDSLASTAPQSFSAMVDFAGSTTTAAVTQSGAGAPTAITAELFTPQGSSRTNPLKVRLGFAPMPQSANASITTDDEASHITLSANAASLLTVDAEDRTGPTALELDATIDELPTSLDLDVVDGGGAAKELHYQASAPIEQIRAALTQTSGATIVQEAVLRIDDLPTRIDITQPGPESVELIANGPIGTVEGGFARNGHVRFLDAVADPSYAYVVDDGSFASRALRARGVSHAKAVVSGDVAIEATLQSSPFRFKLEDGARQMDGRIRNLPSEVVLSYSPANGRVEYTADAEIGEIAVRAVDPAGLLGRATLVDMVVRSLPRELALDFGQDGNTVELDAHGGQIGQIEFTASNGPTPAIPSGRDGIELRDQGAPYLLFGRITGLREATAILAPDPDLAVDAVGGRVFQAELFAGGGTYMQAVLDRLQPDTRIRIFPRGDGSVVKYTAAAPTTSLLFKSNGDDESDFTEATLAPLPASLELCSSKDMACNDSGGSAANAGALRLDASQPTTINLFTCTRPLTGCTAANATESTTVTNFLAQTIGFDADTNGAAGRVFLDTDDKVLSGEVLMKLGNPFVEEVEMSFPPGFKAQNRLVRWPGSEEVVVCIPFVGCHIETIPTPFSRTGTITCPSGTQIAIRLPLVPDPDVTHFLC